MKASLRAEGSDSPWRHDLVETKSHASMAEIMGGLHITVPDVETIVKMITRVPGNQNDFTQVERSFC